jgi:hypothetical protein
MAAPLELLQQIFAGALDDAEHERALLTRVQPLAAVAQS